MLKTAIGDFKGKMLLCAQQGLDLFGGLACSGSFPLTEEHNAYRLTSKLDRFEPEPSKFNYLEAICTPNVGSVILNTVFFEFHSLRSMVEVCNYFVLEWLKQLPASTNIGQSIMTDFVNPEIISQIIARNS